MPAALLRRSILYNEAAICNMSALRTYGPGLLVEATRLDNVARLSHHREYPCNSLSVMVLLPVRTSRAIFLWPNIQPFRRQSRASSFSTICPPVRTVRKPRFCCRAASLGRQASNLLKNPASSVRTSVRELKLSNYRQTVWLPATDWSLSAGHSGIGADRPELETLFFEVSLGRSCAKLCR
jgi:hypothetical protein